MALHFLMHKVCKRRCTVLAAEATSCVCHVLDCEYLLGAELPVSKILPDISDLLLRSISIIISGAIESLGQGANSQTFPL